MYTDEHIAQIAHELNGVIQRSLAERQASAGWEAAPEWKRRSYLAGVRLAAAGATPEQLHEGWYDWHAGEGWTYGEVYDEDAKTHPNMVPWDELPREQQAKGRVFWATVRALSQPDCPA